MKKTIKFSVLAVAFCFVIVLMAGCGNKKATLTSTAETVKVTWEKETAEDFKSYYLSVRKVGTGNIIDEKTITNADTLTFTFTSLSAETNYEIVFKINYNGDKASKTETQTIRTLKK
ncbi:MAG: fibronectin type III domain-containing protein [Firmicutes bacterium]|nr:fibronectin type III domain-containing protein [Bacillota bacterium]